MDMMLMVKNVKNKFHHENLYDNVYNKIEIMIFYFLLAFHQSEYILDKNNIQYALIGYRIHHQLNISGITQ